MKNYFKKAKKNFPLVLSTIIIYHILLTIFFYSKINLHILCWMVVFIAIMIIAKEYRPNFKKALNKLTIFHEEKKEDEEIQE